MSSATRSASRTLCVTSATAPPVGGESDNPIEQSRRFLRGQYRRGFVENQNPGAVRQCADDFESLLCFDGQVAHACAWIDLQPSSPGHRPDPFGRRRRVEAPLIANRHVLRRCQSGDEREMLLNHADSSSDCIAW